MGEAEDLNEIARMYAVSEKYPLILEGMIREKIAGFDLPVGSIVYNPYGWGDPRFKFRVRADRELEILAGNWDPNAICEIPGIAWDL